MREKSRFRLYSASGFAVRLGDFFRAGAFLVAGRLAEVFFAADDLLVEAFFAAFFAAFAPVFALLFFFATGRFTVRLRVVAMVAPRCEEHAEEPRKVGRSAGRQAEVVPDHPTP